MQRTIMIQLTVETKDTLSAEDEHVLWHDIESAADAAARRGGFEVAFRDRLTSLVLDRDELTTADVKIVAAKRACSEPERVERIAKAFDVAPVRVSIDFRIYASTVGEKGGPMWSIYVALPNKDRRKGDRHEHAVGHTLDEAEAELMAVLAPPSSMSRAEKIMRMHEEGLLTLADRDAILATMKERE